MSDQYKKWKEKTADSLYVIWPGSYCRDGQAVGEANKAKLTSEQNI